jgi:hypothetical protein
VSISTIYKYACSVITALSSYTHASDVDAGSFHMLPFNPFLDDDFSFSIVFCAARYISREYVGTTNIETYAYISILMMLIAICDTSLYMSMTEWKEKEHQSKRALYRALEEYRVSEKPEKFYSHNLIFILIGHT